MVDLSGNVSEIFQGAFSGGALGGLMGGLLVFGIAIGSIGMPNLYLGCAWLYKINQLDKLIEIEEIRLDFYSMEFEKMCAMVNQIIRRYGLRLIQIENDLGPNDESTVRVRKHFKERHRICRKFLLVDGDQGKYTRSDPDY